jgi:hypothetical protein
VDNSAAARKALRAIAIPAACIHRLLLSLGEAQLRASLQTSPEDLAARERLINYYFDEATAPPRFRRTPLHDAEFTEQMHHPPSSGVSGACPQGAVDTRGLLVRPWRT